MCRSHLLHKCRGSLLRNVSHRLPCCVHAAPLRLWPGALGMSSAAPVCAVGRLLRDPALRVPLSLLQSSWSDPALTEYVPSRRQKVLQTVSDLGHIASGHRRAWTRDGWPFYTRHRPRWSRLLPAQNRGPSGARHYLSRVLFLATAPTAGRRQPPVTK
jgi:hypothetical protein